MMSDEAKQAYKKMANIHVEENIYHAYQLMNSPVITIRDIDTIEQCWAKMVEYDLKQMPIMGANGKIKGLATMKSIAKALIKHLDDANYIYEAKVDTIAIHDIMTAEPIADIRRVAKVMVQYHLNCIPIVSTQSHEVVGIISRSDILKAIASNPHFQLWA